MKAAIAYSISPAGPGTVASRVNMVSGASCLVSGVDSSEDMLTRAGADKSVDWHFGRAEDLPFVDDIFDVVLCQQGLQYFTDRGKAMKEMARVLRPGGRIAIAVWGAIERQPFYLALEDGFSRYLPEAKNAYDQAFSLNTVKELRSLASDAGFKDPRVRFEHKTIRHPSDLIRGAQMTESASTLLVSGALVWLGNCLVFGLLYWHFDSEGPLARYRGDHTYRDFAFTQHLSPDLAPEGWRPQYVDYLILGLTTSTAFSPTDVMPSPILNGTLKRQAARTRNGARAAPPSSSLPPRRPRAPARTRQPWWGSSSYSVRPRSACSAVANRRASRPSR